MFEFRNICLVYFGKEFFIIDQVWLMVGVYLFVGVNGVGKFILFCLMIFGLVQGMLLGGQEFKVFIFNEWVKRIVFVFSFFLGFDYLNFEEYLLFGWYLYIGKSGWFFDIDRVVMQDYVEFFWLMGMLGCYIFLLSDGECQCVFIVWVFIQQIFVILFDEFIFFF